ncbi:hypothetical protein H6F93_20255 [Leptolyngbya sp. FACHB-671]|uniref:hypothetical protein n=1 Tax=Leptolyngbya sp. FACHB-671 TaxID=2692812 RepID=UPI001683E5C9|nr:hypothetical protein [Leptolyngbya sp. FACHB-671]MBD2069817.1 hypothetical protein [Leptolyngbya sp. FACHB-671]
MALFINHWIKCPLEQARGLGSCRTGVYILVLVKAPVEETAQALSTTRGMNVWEKNVYGQEIKILYESTFVLRFWRHSWSMIYMPSVIASRIDENRRVGDLSKYRSLVRPPYVTEPQQLEEIPELAKPKRKFNVLQDQDTLELSRLLNTHAIYYWDSDGESIEYQLYSSGALQEKFFYEVGFPIQFQSELRRSNFHRIRDIRKIRDREIRDRTAFSFMDEFLKQQDAYIPDLAVVEHVVNEDLVVEVKDLAPDGIERVDYLAFQ